MAQIFADKTAAYFKNLRRSAKSAVDILNSSDLSEWRRHATQSGFDPIAHVAKGERADHVARQKMMRESQGNGAGVIQPLELFRRKRDASAKRSRVFLLAVAQAIAPNLEEDEKELKAQGFTSARRAAEFTAVVESALTALYSSVDCTRKILNILYPKAQGLPESTRKLF